MSELPRGWIESSIKDVGVISSGFGFPDRFQGNVTGELPFAKVRDISQAHQRNGGLLSSAANYISRDDLVALKARTVPAGSVAFAKIGEALKLNRRVLLDVEAVLDNNCMAVTPHQGLVDPNFLYRFLTTLDFAPFSVATTVPSIRKGDVGSIRLPLPPLAEQKRIVAKLDALNAKSARTRTELARIETLVCRYKQAVLSKALSGELTASQRSAPPLRVEVREMLSELTQGWSPKCEKISASSDEQWAVITTTSIQSFSFHANENKVLPADLLPREHLVIEEGDVLITRAGPRVRCGVCCYVERTRPRLILCDKAYRLRLKDQFDPKFFVFLVNSPELLSRIEDMKTGGNDSGLNLTQERFTSLVVPMWPLEEQHEIVRRIESAFARIDRLAKEAKRALELVGRLDEAILAKAFRGELVPQDENDEPAEHLLARIRAEREVAPKGKRGLKNRA